MSDLRNWIVWSNEHRAFWRPERRGYTQRIEQAGRYTKAEAETICKGANYRALSDLRSGTPPEIMMPAPEAMDGREREPAPIHMVRVDIQGCDETPWDIWFRDRAELDAFLADRPKGLGITDIHELAANTAESALLTCGELIAAAALDREQSA